MDAGMASKSDAIQVAGHIYIGKQCVHIFRFKLEHCNSFSGMGSLQYVKPIFEKRFYYCHSDKWVIIDHDYDSFSDFYFLAHEPLRVSIPNRSAFSFK